MSAIIRESARVTEGTNRFGETYYAIEDEAGLVSVHLTREEAENALRGEREMAEPLISIG